MNHDDVVQWHCTEAQQNAMCGYRLLARAGLGWTPRYGDLETIIAHAWSWELKAGSRGK